MSKNHDFFNTKWWNSSFLENRIHENKLRFLCNLFWKLLRLRLCFIVVFFCVTWILPIKNQQKVKLILIIDRVLLWYTRVYDVSHLLESYLEWKYCLKKKYFRFNIFNAIMLHFGTTYFCFILIWTLHHVTLLKRGSQMFCWLWLLIYAVTEISVLT